MKRVQSHIRNGTRGRKKPTNIDRGNKPGLIICLLKKYPKTGIYIKSTIPLVDNNKPPIIPRKYKAI